MRILRTTLLGLLAFGLVGIQGSASAALITVVSAVASSEFSAARPAIHTIDGSGLSLTGGFGVGVHSEDPQNTSWLNAGTLGAGTDTLPATITFDLGDNYELNNIWVWNYNEGGSGGIERGAEDVTISVSDDGITFTPLAISSFTLLQATGSSTYIGDAIPGFDVTDPLLDDVRAVRFDITSAFTDVLNLAGLSEVQFDGVLTTVIPEPSSLAMAGLGMFGIGGFGRRRRR